MYILRYIALSIFTFFMISASAEAHSQPSLTKEQQQILATLKKEYQAYEQEHQKEFKRTKELQQQFITKNKEQFNKMIALEKQFKEENKETIDKLIQAKKKFQKEHPDIKFHTNSLLSTKDINMEKKYHIIYMKLLHESMYGVNSSPHKMHHHKNMNNQKGKQNHNIHKQFMAENKDIIDELKASHKKFEQAHRQDWSKLQTLFNTYYNKNRADLLKVHTLKKQFMEEHKEKISKLGSAAPWFFREIKLGF